MSTNLSGTARPAALHLLKDSSHLIILEKPLIIKNSFFIITVMLTNYPKIVNKQNKSKNKLTIF
jgi:hypothetical protein